MEPFVWPSGGWLAHWRGCRPSRCTHLLDMPGWWLAMSARGIPLAAGREAALEAAARMVGGYKGYPKLTELQREFVQGLVLDCLTAAPQPVTHAWVRHALGLSANLVRWASGEGLPLDREVLLTRHQINRWVHVGLASHPASTRATYRSRVEIMAAHVSTEPWDRRRYTLPKGDVGLPLTGQEQADLWLWSRQIPSHRQRARISASVALGLGCGLTYAEEGHVYREDVTRDLAGAHVTVRAGRNGKDRTVTCLRAWEGRLWELVKDVPAGHLVGSPWRTTPQTKNAYAQMVAATKRGYPSPVEWSHQRARRTWLATHMAAGTPFNVLLTAAGLSSAEALLRVLPYLPEATPGETSRWLRGAP